MKTVLLTGAAGGVARFLRRDRHPAKTGDEVADRHQGGRFCSSESGGDPTKPELD